MRSKVLVCDGAVGTQIYEKGVPYGRCLDILNVNEPGLVFSIHEEYVRAGADIIETNTYGANAVKLAAFGYAHRVREINQAGAALARRAASRGVYVAGAVGPLGPGLEPLGIARDADVQSVFEEQVSALAESGVDLIILETLSDLAEACAALRAVKAVCDLPVVCQMSFLGDGYTAAGVSPLTAAARLTPLRPDALGLNCGSGPYDAVTPLRELAGATGGAFPLSVQPNAGVSRGVDGRVVCSSSPAYFASFWGEWVFSGARIIGGCCGTTPDHTRALVDARNRMKAPQTPAQAAIAAPGSRPALEAPAHAFPGKGRPEEPGLVPGRNLLDKMRERFVITVEIDPPKGAGFSRVLAAVRLLRQCGVDSVNIADNPMARMRMSPIALAHLIQEKGGMETILHLTCRDRNLLGLQSDLIGAWALGIRSVLALTGDPPARGDHPGAAAVFDVNSTGLINIVAALNAGHDVSGNSLPEPTRFAVGAAVDPGANDLERELGRLEEKVSAGAAFVLTQPVFDPAVLERFVARASGLRIPVIAGILPLRSARHARFLHNEVPGMVIPEWIRSKMEAAGNDSAAGVQIAADTLREIKPISQGAYITPPFDRYEVVPEILDSL